MNNYLITFVVIMLFDIYWVLIAKKELLKIFGYKNDIFPTWFIVFFWVYNIFGLWCLYMGI